ncbi:MAG TPA: flagellar protein FlgN [Halanaerobiales bacterium]|nr:flagellar protein FlgN [Halanaerobiales bacterium]
MDDKLLESLFNILMDEYENYCLLGELAQKKKDVLIENDVEELTRLIEKDNEIVDQIERLEEKRLDLFARFVENSELAEDEISFSDLLELLSGEWQQKLLSIKEKLLGIIEGLHEQNEQNKALVEEAIKLNNFSVNMFMEAVEPDNQIYEPGEKKRGNLNKRSHIVDRKG